MTTTPFDAQTASGQPIFCTADCGNGACFRRYSPIWSKLPDGSAMHDFSEDCAAYEPAPEPTLDAVLDQVHAFVTRVAGEPGPFGPTPLVIGGYATGGVVTSKPGLVGDQGSEFIVPRGRPCTPP